jgi:mRNA-degrading endonuclease RelE of RelBE toxin-antitoxin system
LKVSTNNQAAASGATLSVDDLEAALRLLSAEKRAGRTNWHKFIVVLLESISLGIFTLTIPIGLLVVWFNPWLGWGLFKAAFISAIVFFFVAIKWGEVAPPTTKIRATLGESLSKTAKDAWRKRSDSINTIIGLLSLPLLIGFVWLVYGLITTGEVILSSLTLIALPVLIFWVLVAIDNYRESEYLLQVSRLRDQLESRLQEVSKTGSSEVPLSSEEINLLSQVETRVEMKHVEDKVAQLKHERPDEQLYSIAIALEPLKYLDSLAEREPEARIAIREAWDELPTEPKPPEAQPAPGRENGFVIRRGQYDIIYLVDDQKHRIDVVEIQEIHQEEPTHAS